MAQIFSVALKLGNPNKSGDCKVYIRVYGGGKEFKLPTLVRVKKGNFNGSKIVRLPNANELNRYLEEEMSKARKLILNAQLNGDEITANLFDTESGEGKIQSYIDEFLRLKKTDGTRVSNRLALKSVSHLRMSDIKPDTLLKVEEELRNAGLDQNTLNTRLKRIKSFLNYLIKQKVIKNERVIESIRDYTPPRYIQKIPEYLTEEELQNWMTLVRVIQNKTKKMCGYYFLLSCLTGWRLSDLKSFDYNKSVKDGMLILRAKKNNNIVSITIYPELQEVLEFCKDNPLNISEQGFRLYVKDIASDIGINQSHRNIKIHSGRHTFAMRLLNRGFTIDEVAELLGDSPEVARVYARVTNTQINEKIKRVFF